MDLGLDRKVVIITGGASNIGRELALEFARERAVVVIADIDEAQGRRAIADVAAAGATDTLLVRTDITSVESVGQMVETVTARFGHIDVLVNNAGWVVDRLFVEKPRAEMEKEVQINLWGNINCTRAVIDGMIERKSGVIVSIASDAGRMGEFREAVYGACKGGVIAFTKSLARELGKYGIRLNAVCPGMTVPESDEFVGSSSLWAESSMSAVRDPEIMQRIAKSYPLRRTGKPSDIAGAVLYLASERASFVTGQTLSVSGGYTMM